MLGEDHPDTLTSRINLAGAYQEAGDLGRAIPLHEQTLTDCARMLGEDHPATLTFRSNLAGAYQEAGCIRAGPSRCTAPPSPTGRRVLGEDHPLTMAVRGNLHELTGR